MHDFGWAGDCRDENGILGRCVAGAINNYTTQLLSYGNRAADSQCKLFGDQSFGDKIYKCFYMRIDLLKIFYNITKILIFNC